METAVLNTSIHAQNAVPSKSSTHTQDSSLPAGFVYLSDVDSSIVQEIRYAGFHNFIGAPVKGYLSARCILTKKAAISLKAVQDELKKSAMSLKVYDCYRPQQAVNHLLSWVKTPHENKMKAEFYPRTDKNTLLQEGYIASKSAHSRGSTVDLTIVRVPIIAQYPYTNDEVLRACTLPAEERFKDNSLDFGTGFDCFDVLSHTEHHSMSATQKASRHLLKTMMAKYHFKNYAREWWHYTLVNEPYPTKYFDFEIQ